MSDLVSEAISYANLSEHEGAGYTLGIQFVSEECVEVVVHGLAGSHVLKTVAGDEPFFPNPDYILHVTVLW